MNKYKRRVSKESTQTEGQPKEVYYQAKEYCKEKKENVLNVTK